MSFIKKVVHKDEYKRTPYEPLAAIHYDGSYGCARDVLRMIQVKNLSLPANMRSAQVDDIIDSIMGNDSNLSIPQIIGDPEMKLLGHRPQVLKVDQWLVMEIDAGGNVELVFYPSDQFERIFTLGTY